MIQASDVLLYPVFKMWNKDQNGSFKTHQIVLGGHSVVEIPCMSLAVYTRIITDISYSVGILFIPN